MQHEASQEANHAMGHGNAQVHTKIKIQKFLLKALRPFIRKFAPPKISRYTVATSGEDLVTCTLSSLAYSS